MDLTIVTTYFFPSISIISSSLAVYLYKKFKNNEVLLQKTYERMTEENKEKDRVLSLFDVGEIVMFKWKNDPNWSVEYVSRSVNKVFGYERNLFLKSEVKYSSVIHPDDLNIVIKEVTESVISGKKFFTHRPYRIITKQGEIKWLLDSTRILRDDNGEVTHFLGYISDITYIKNSELEIEASRKLFQIAIEGNGDGLWDWNIAKNHVSFSKEWKAMFGFEDNEIGNDLSEWSKRVHKDDLATVQKDISDYLSGKSDKYINSHRVLCKNGNFIWVLDRGIAIEWDSSGKPTRMVGTHSDITESKKLEESLIKARDDAESANRAKSSFLANMSHEIRTPLNGIIGLIDLTLGTILNETQKDYLSKAKTSSKALLNILNDILDYSKVEAGKIELENNPFSIKKTVQTVCDLFQYQAEEKHLKLTCNINNDIPNNLKGDTLRLSQILNNLVGNAIKFTDYGKVELDVSINNKLDNIIELKFEVKDSGIGIEQEKLQRLFQPFSQADNSHTRKYGGTGLGLVISQRLANLFGGKLSVKSEKGIGSNFYFTAKFEILPMSTVDNSELNNDDEVGSIEGIKVLLVEDNDINLIVASKNLQKFGVIYETAKNGAEATELIELKGGDKFDLILMDIQMPIMDGYTATQHIRKLYSKNLLPIIAMSAAVMKEDREEAFRVGMNDHISKPFKAIDLKKMIYKWSKKTNLINHIKQDKIKTTEFLPKAEPIKRVIKLIDPKQGMEYLLDDEDLYYQLLDSFYKKYNLAHKYLKELFDNNKITDAKSYLHTIKGLSGQISAQALFNEVKYLESEVITGNIPNLSKFEQIITEVLDEINYLISEKYNKNIQTTSVQTLNYNQCQSIFFELEEHLKHSEAIHYNDIVAFKDCLHSYASVDEVNQFFNYIENYDFREAMNCLDKIKTILIKDSTLEK